MYEQSVHSRQDTTFLLAQPGDRDFRSDSASRLLGGEIRFLPFVFAGLVFVYHAQHTFAEVVRGSDTDAYVSVTWEYDLETGTGQLIIENLNLPLDMVHPQLYMGGLIPECVENIVLSAAVSLECLPFDVVFADLQPGGEGTLSFKFCGPTQSAVMLSPLGLLDPVGRKAVFSELSGRTCSAATLPPCSLIRPVCELVEYGVGHTLSGVCLQMPKGLLSGFVTVQPIECPAADRDFDGDVDLQDFAYFQQGFTEPIELRCYREFRVALTGPQ